ncbi:MAG: CPBP family intramembrane metalloprotease domain-containing protein [Verrucomicrobia bacterium]|nr:MAG: CPBP family intramembrane metalloprotease domain-containing protein [Verrucomicrobiota bacterium]
MENGKARAWKKIGLFYGLTMLFSGIFDGFVLHAGKMDAGNLLYVTGSMWSPALAAFATKRIFGERIRDLPWKWGPIRYPWLGYLIPIAYALPVYLVVWVGGLGGFADAEFIKQTAAQFGWSNFPPALTLTLFILLTATLGLVGKTSRALGEEIGWRGFLVPELAKVVSFPAIGIISGLMWAVYHYPVLLFADYNAGTPPWYGLSCFTIMVVADSFILAWLTLRSGSLWPAAIFHGSHNLFIQSIFTPLTRQTGPTKYIIDEFGIGLVITVTIAAIVVWRHPRSWTPATSP